MDKPKTELADLDQPLEELSAEQATDVRGGLFTTGLTDTSLGASTTQATSSSKQSPTEITIPKSTDTASSKLF